MRKTIVRKRKLAVGCSGKLTTSGEAVGHETLKQDRVEVGSSEIDGSCVARRS